MIATWYDAVLPPIVTLAVVCVGAMLLWLARGKLADFAREVGVQRISAFGVDLQFAERQATAAYEKQGLGPPSDQDKAAIRDAARFLAPLAAQTHVLWIDDNPGNNTLERSTFLSWEIDVQTVRTTDDALRELRDRRQTFDVVISDWSRPKEDASASAGLRLLARMRELDLHQPVIFYHGLVPPDELAERRRRAREAGAVGATGSPGELFRWTLVELVRVALDQPDRMERRRRDSLSSAAAV